MRKLKRYHAAAYKYNIPGQSIHIQKIITENDIFLPDYGKWYGAGAGGY